MGNQGQGWEETWISQLTFGPILATSLEGTCYSKIFASEMQKSELLSVPTAPQGWLEGSARTCRPGLGLDVSASCPAAGTGVLGPYTTQLENLAGRGRAVPPGEMAKGTPCPGSQSHPSQQQLPPTVPETGGESDQLSPRTPRGLSPQLCLKTQRSANTRPQATLRTPGSAAAPATGPQKAWKPNPRSSERAFVERRSLRCTQLRGCRVTPVL